MEESNSQVDRPTSRDRTISQYQGWDGQPLTAEGEVAFVILDDSSSSEGFPTPVIAAAHGGGKTCLLHPGLIAGFLKTHAGVRLVCERAGHLHGIIEGYLQKFPDQLALVCLWEFSGTGRLLDVILLDQLVEMAEHGVEKNPARFTEVARDRCGLELPVSSHGSPTSAPGFASGLGPLENHATSLVHALMDVYRMLRQMADKLAVPHEDGDEPDQEVGPLSLGIQVRGDVALARLTQSGQLCVRAVGDLIEHCESVYQETSRQLLNDRASERCFGKDGSLIRVDSKGHPVKYKDRLRPWLEKCLGEIQGAHGLSFRPPQFKEGKTALSVNSWAEFIPYHPSLSAWERLETAAIAKALLTIARTELSPRIRSSYQTLPRVRSVDPNLESLRGLSANGLFTAPPGHSFLLVELCDLELICLANTYTSIEGPIPRMASLLDSGLEPARYAAAVLYGYYEIRCNPAACKRFDELQHEDARMFEGWMSVAPLQENFDELERAKPTTFQAWMTIARTVLHDAPRGLSSRKIARMIQGRMGDAIRAIPEEAIESAYRLVLMAIFPELNRVGSSQTFERVRSAFCTDFLNGGIAFSSKGEGFEHHLRAVIGGQTTDRVQLPILRELCADEALKSKLNVGSPALYDEIFRRPQRTGYGRVRAMLESHQADAANLLDQADDIRKSVLYAIVAAGHDLVAVAGDEFVILLPSWPMLGATKIEELIHDLKITIEQVIGEFLVGRPARMKVIHCEEW